MSSFLIAFFSDMTFLNTALSGFLIILFLNNDIGSRVNSHWKNSSMLSSCAAVVTILINIKLESTDWSPPCVVLVFCCSAWNGFIWSFRLAEASLKKALSNAAWIVLPTSSAFSQLISSPSVYTSPVDSECRKKIPESHPVEKFETVVVVLLCSRSSHFLMLFTWFRCCTCELNHSIMDHGYVIKA